VVVKNILIIGGSYFTGKVFVEELLKDDEDFNIYILNRGTRPLNLSGVFELKCDRHNETSLKDCLPEIHWDTVVDFCAYKPDDISIIFSVLSLFGFDIYIFISSSSVYADSDLLPVTENHPMISGPQPQLGVYSHYGYNKYQSEIVLKNLCLKNDIPYLILRPSIIYGRYNYANRENYFFDMVDQNEDIIIPSDSLALYSMVYVEDIARILILALKNNKLVNKSFNLSSAEQISYSGIVRTISRIVGKPINIRKLPCRDIISQKIPLPFPIDLHLIYSGNAVLKELNFQYTLFADGIKDTYEFYNQSGVR
jgi:nucleoside-diphosphate-sugar epimerase